ncbi:hypothetical protein MASR2M12_07700 [Bacteroidales bacterium]
MNKLTYSIIVLALSTFSCTKQEIVYSCDPIINEWATKYSDNFHNITRKQLATLPPSLQKAIYRTLTGAENYDLWMEKLDIVKNDTSRSDLKNEVEVLIEKMNHAWYERDMKESLNESDSIFLYNWEKQILESKIIDSATFIINFCTLMTANEIDSLLSYSEVLDHSWIEDFNLPEITTSFKATTAQDCSCRYDIYCNFFLAEECKTGGCNLVYDCGIVGSSACKGLCPEEIAPTP